MLTDLKVVERPAEPEPEPAQASALIGMTEEERVAAAKVPERAAPRRRQAAP